MNYDKYIEKLDEYKQEAEKIKNSYDPERVSRWNDMLKLETKLKN